MIRIEKFKSLLRERIADYESQYEKTGNKMIFGALQEAKDTLAYVESQFPEILSPRYPVPLNRVNIQVRVSEELPGEEHRKLKLGTMRQVGKETLMYEEHIVEESIAYILESFGSALIGERDKLVRWRKNEDSILGELVVIAPKEGESDEKLKLF